MYLSHYNLAEKPFQITTDPKFLWLGEKHQEALATLKYGVADNKGFLLLTGDVGTGKTTLINTLLRDLDSNTIVATVVDPNSERLEFFNFLATAFGIEEKFTKKVDFLSHFTEFLNNAYLSNKKVLLIIDEAQRLSTELLEEIRLLSNIERENTKLLNIFFVGQNEFEKTLIKEGCRALRQRITITYRINTLTETETTEYIKYRLKVAGTEKEVFNRKAIREIYAFSRGYPRLINIICDHALLTGYVKELKMINRAIIKECAQELVLQGETRSKELQRHISAGKQKKKPLFSRAAVYVCLMLLIVFFGYLFYSSGYNNYIVSLKDYYNHIFGSLEGSSSRQQIGKIPASEPQQPLMSDPVSLAEEDDRSVSALAGDIKREEPASDDNTPQADQAVPQESRTDTVEQNLLSKGEEPMLSVDLKLSIPFNINMNVLSPKAYGLLDRLAAAMVKNHNIEIVVTGYTDTLGDYHYNKKLSEFRANIVKSYLVAKGISPLRIQPLGMGEENPLEPNTSKAGRRANRRVEIELHPGSND